MEEEGKGGFCRRRQGEVFQLTWKATVWWRQTETPLSLLPSSDDEDGNDDDNNDDDKRSSP